MLRADRTRIPRTTYSGPCSSALLILQDLPALAGPAVALCTNFARILSVPLQGESIRFRGRSRNTPGPVISGDGRTSSVYCDLPIAPGTGRDQPHHLASLAGFQSDHHRSAPSIHSGCV